MTQVLFFLTTAIMVLAASCAREAATLAAEEQIELQRAQNFYLKRNFPAAEKLFKKLQAKYPHSLEINGPLAKIYFFDRRFHQAEELLRQLLEEEEKNPYLLMWLGRVLSIDSSRRREALQIFREIIYNDPENYMAHYYLGRTLEAQNRPREALLAYKSALAMEYQAGRVHFRLGKLLTALQMKERAHNHLKRAAEIEAQFPTSR